MEEELQKRNTDCVYFLASPLTCKKGIECEYRHNEIARLNPRDCWYWLAGSCLNPTCAFRHPPLDACTETGDESASDKQQSALPANKVAVPCYYFYNGFCNKGESCFFMHGPDGNAPSWKSSKQPSTTVDGPVLEKKMSKGSDSRPAAAEISSFRTDVKSTAGTGVTSEQKSDQEVPDNVTEHNACRQISQSPSEEAATIRSNSPSQTGGLVQRSQESPYQSSDNQFDDHVKQEDWLESSPGFDVLVNDRAEDVDDEDEALCTLHHDMEEREINGQRLRYDYEDNIEYDPTRPDIRVSFQRGLPDYYGYVEKDPYNITRRSPISTRERVLDHTMLSRRGLSSVDLRDFLKKRRGTESQNANIFFGRPNSSGLMGQITEKAYFGNRGLHGRLASKVEISIESQINREPLRVGTYHHHRTRHAVVSKRFKKATKERRQAKRHGFSEIPGKTASRKRRSVEDSCMFTGPKTLAQLKEEKKKVLGNADVCEGTGASSSKT